MYLPIPPVIFKHKTIWKRYMVKRGFEKYELQDTMRILTRIVNTYNMLTQLGVENFDGVFAMILNNVFKYYTKGI